MFGMRSTMFDCTGLWVCGRRCSSHKSCSESDHVAIEGLPLEGLRDGEVAVLDLYDIARVRIDNVGDVFDVVLESGDLLPLHRCEVMHQQCQSPIHGKVGRQVHRPLRERSDGLAWQ